MDDPEITEQEILAEISRLKWDKQHGEWRFFVRLLRVACGFALAAIAYWLFDSGPSIADTPLASLTLKAIAGAIIHTGGALLALSAAFPVAFGEAPDLEPDAAFRERAIANARRRKLALLTSLEHTSLGGPSPPLTFKLSSTVTSAWPALLLPL